MKRREFVKKSVSAGFVTGTALAFGSINNLFGKPPLPYSPVDLVAVKGGNPGQMFDQGIEALGGIEKFVKPNQTVVVKPNIGWTEVLIRLRILIHTCYQG